MSEQNFLNSLRETWENLMKAGVPPTAREGCPFESSLSSNDNPPPNSPCLLSSIASASKMPSHHRSHHQAVGGKVQRPRRHATRAASPVRLEPCNFKAAVLEHTSQLLPLPATSPEVISQPTRSTPLSIPTSTRGLASAASNFTSPQSLPSTWGCTHPASGFCIPHSMSSNSSSALPSLYSCNPSDGFHAFEHISFANCTNRNLHYSSSEPANLDALQYDVNVPSGNHVPAEGIRQFSSVLSFKSLERFLMKDPAP